VEVCFIITYLNGRIIAEHSFLAARATELVIINAVMKAESLLGFTSYNDLKINKDQKSFAIILELYLFMRDNIYRN